MTRWLIHRSTPTKDGCRLTEIGGAYAKDRHEAERVAVREFGPAKYLVMEHFTLADVVQQPQRYSGGRW